MRRRNVQSLVEQGQKGELTMQPGKSMMESLESSINKVRDRDYCMIGLLIRELTINSRSCKVGNTVVTI